MPNTNPPPAPTRGNATRAARAAIKRRIKADALILDEDAWYELVEAPAVAGVFALDFVQWLPRLGQGNPRGAASLARELIDNAGIAPTRTMGELTLRQAAALVKAIIAWSDAPARLRRKAAR